MDINYNNTFLLIAVAIALLFGLVMLVRQWREQVYDLQGKTALITGGSRGLGLVLARQLIAAGARVAICARDGAELERAQAELEQQGGAVLTEACDVTDRAQVESMVQRVKEHFGTINILINTLGLTSSRRLRT